MKTTKRILALVLVIAIIAVGLTGCNKKEDSKTLVIGGIGPLSGDYANYGVSVREGADIAIKEINDAGGVNGIKLELKFEDDQADSQKAVNAYNKLMDDGMKVSLGAVFSGPCIAVTEEAKKDGILLLTPSGSQLECTQYPNNFRVCFNDPQQGTVSAAYISENLTAKKIAILYESTNSYSTGIVDKFEAEAAKKGLSIVDKQAFTDKSNTDFSAQLQSIKSKGAELIFLPIYAADAANILVQANQAGLKVPFFGCDGLDGVVPKLADKKAVAEGVMLLTPFAADSKDPTSQKFTTAYKAAYNNKVPDQFAADGYDAIYAIKAALEQAEIKDANIDVKELGDKLIAAMTKITVVGATGTMTWDKDGETNKAAKAVKIQNGVYVALS